jgi:hypothetical protein
MLLVVLQIAWLGAFALTALSAGMICVEFVPDVWRRMTRR